jgi:hypothetical protein
MRNERRAGLLGFVLVFAVGCGGASIPPGDAGVKLAEAFCARGTECYGDLFAESEATCRSSAGPSLRDTTFALIQTAILAGTVKYSGDKMGEIADSLRKAPCEDLYKLKGSGPASFLAAAVVGNVALGGACHTQLECAGAGKQAFCDTSQCAGTCASSKPEGGSCHDSRECQDGLACQDSTIGGAVCRKPAAANQACLGPDGAADCLAGYLCVDGSHATAGTCKALTEQMTGKEGALCDTERDRWCLTGLSCAQKAGGSVCVAKSKAGGQCWLGAPNPCPDGQYCAVAAPATEGTCTARPVAGQGCADAACAAGFACDRPPRIPPTCFEKQPIGRACSFDGACYSGRCEASTCAARSCD